MKAIEMSVREWIEIPDNPRQRDTEGRAKRAKHLREYKKPHRRVDMAVLNGDRWKIDGHTRAFKWEDGTLPMPPDGRVLVTVYPVDSIEEVKAGIRRAHRRDAVIYQEG